MKLYNATTDKIEEVGATIITADGTLYTDKLSDEQLNGYGYHRVSYGEYPDRKYYTATESGSLVNGVYVISYTPAARDLAEVKQLLKNQIKDTFLAKEANPIIDTGLGFSVDGGRKNLEDFKIGKEFALPSVKASDNTFHTITDANYDAIILAIKMNGLGLYQTKWTKEAEVDALATVEDCLLYIATPYIINEEEVDPITLLGTGVFHDVVKYKNNCAEW